nr:Mitochondrial translation factor like [Ipomoea batatas]
MSQLFIRNSNSGRCKRIKVGSFNDNSISNQPERSGIQLYRDIERLLTDTVKQSQDAWGTSKDWKEVEGAWVLGPINTKPRLIVHFVGGIFVGAAPQLTYRLFLERLVEKDILVIATPYASGFDHFFIADEVQFKFDRFLDFSRKQYKIFLFLALATRWGSRYAVQRSGNILMSFNNKEASLAIPLFSPVLVPMAQSIGPFLSQIATSPTVRLGVSV